MKGENTMSCPALRELFAPELAEAENRVSEKTTEKNVFEFIQKGYFSIEIGAKELNLSEKDFVQKMKERGFVVPIMG